MQEHNLVLLLPVGSTQVKKAISEDQTHILREEIFRDASICLLNNRGNGLRTFLPKSIAWEQPLYHPHGIIFGAEDSGLFMYFFGRAKAEQEDQIAIQKLCSVLLQAEYQIEGEIGGVTFAAYAAESPPSCAWLEEIESGEFKPDSVLYSLAHNKSILSDDEREIITSVNKYALCLLTVFTE